MELFLFFLQSSLCGLLIFRLDQFKRKKYISKKIAPNQFMLYTFAILLLGGACFCLVWRLSARLFAALRLRPCFLWNKSAEFSNFCTNRIYPIPSYIFPIKLLSSKSSVRSAAAGHVGQTSSAQVGHSVAAIWPLILFKWSQLKVQGFINCHLFIFFAE